jgi:FdhE protein
MKYFYSDEEPEYRVDTCGQCNSYLKTLDTRQANRILYFPLEQTATLHLDWSAQEKGFRQPMYMV